MRRRSILSLFGRKPVAEQPGEAREAKRRRVSEPLPPSAIAAIESASIVVRPGTREDGPRAIVAFPGRPGWTWSRENAAQVFEAGWPDLNAAQAAQAAARLSTLVHLHMQNFASQADPSGASADARAWKDRF